MKSLNQEYINVVKRLINQTPFYGLMSMELCEMGFGYSKVELILDKKHLNNFGGVHGGVYATVIDTAAYWAVYCDIDEEAGLTTIDLKVDNLAAVQEGRLIIEGKRIKAGRTICLSEAVITDIEGKKLAHGTSKQMITQGLQTMSKAAEKAGGEYYPLPPKFFY